LDCKGAGGLFGDLNMATGAENCSKKTLELPPSIYKHKKTHLEINQSGF
jgi:hypothetical protein